MAAQIDDAHSSPAAPPTQRRVGFRIDREKIIEFGLRILPAIDRLLMRFAIGREQPIVPNTIFPWADELQANWRVIRDEAEALLQDRRVAPPLREISSDHDKIAVDDKWRSFFFWGYGLRVDANCARCPETAKILDRIPGLMTGLYSVMLAGARVPLHTGPTKAILTGHLGLVVPRRREACHMAVADENVVWEEGKLFVFDDMFPHEVWNDTDEDRIILMMHIKRPLRFPGSLFRDLLFAAVRASPFVRDAVKNIERLEQERAAKGPA
jgi:beta-hydroxylase